MYLTLFIDQIWFSLETVSSRLELSFLRSSKPSSGELILGCVAHWRLIALREYSSMVSPDSETVPNTLVLVGHGISGDLRRMEEMKISTTHALYVLIRSTDML